MSNCLRCNAKTEVVDTRPTKNNTLRRRRVCTQCNYKFSTLEIPVSHHPRAQELVEWVAEQNQNIWLDGGQVKDGWKAKKAQGAQ